MPNPSTPPHSKGTPSGSVLSETTPLKRDLSGSQIHSTPPQTKASARYRDMARDACEKFVGPMPVDKFLFAFVPKTTDEVRPADEIPFSPDSVSQNEEVFVSYHTPKVVSIFTAITDRCNQGIRPLF